MATASYKKITQLDKVAGNICSKLDEMFEEKKRVLITQNDIKEYVENGKLYTESDDESSKEHKQNEDGNIVNNSSEK